MDNQNISISSFSSHLFWDVDKNKLNLNSDQGLLINRVLEYGLYNDWLLLKAYFGIDVITKTALTSKEISPKTASFLSALTKIPTEQFSCYTTKQSPQNFWNS